MMAEKARSFGDFAMLEKIMQADDLKQIKGYGREVKHFDGEVWTAKACDIVKWARTWRNSVRTPIFCAFCLAQAGVFWWRPALLTVFEVSEWTHRIPMLKIP